MKLASIIALVVFPSISFSPGCRTGESSVGQPQQPMFAPAPSSPFAAGNQPSSIAVGDLNNDGKLDVVTANTGSKDVTALLGDGRGGFKPGPGSPFKVGIAPEFVAVGDLNQDGRLDLAAAAHDENYDVIILEGDGRGRFKLAPTSPITPLKVTDPHNHGLVLGDVNGDGMLDIVTANAGMNRGKADNCVSVLLGQGRGKFKLASGSPLGLGRMPANLTIGDLNRDGKLDLVSVNEASKDMTVLLGDGFGRFNTTSSSPIALQNSGNSVAIGFMNEDSNPDLVMTHDDSTLLTVLFGDGQGGFKATPASSLDLGRKGWNIVLIDLSGDKKMDLVMRTQGNSIAVIPGDGMGGFVSALASPFTVGREPFGIAVADVNADGKPDILTANRGSNNVTLLFGQ